MSDPESVDTGTGYGRPRPTFMRELTLVGPGTPKQLDALAEGRDPIGVSFDADAPPVRFEAGNFLIERQPHAS